ncbi:MAG: 5-(carboxyamino)imidazole ribonucleotide synthase [Bacteroidota bacterium]
MKKEIIQTKIGVLGGGQLGKMLQQAASNWHVQLHFLDQSKEFPAGPLSPHFKEGNFKNYEDVYAFGQDKDVITIEIEHVNTEALHQLVAEGKTVHPAPDKLDIIKDKGLQKQFYQRHRIPTSNFVLYANGDAIRQAVQDGALSLPFVQKSRTAGYDGKGVAVIKTKEDLANRLMDTASVVEDLVPIAKELAVIVARNEAGELRAFPTVEMEFSPVANLVEFLFCPANIDTAVEQKAVALARQVMEAFDLCGLLAVELFLTENGEILVNEVAPRPHNSGHHTIDSAFTSQFEQHLRAILNLPLGDTSSKTPGVMVNLLGAPEHTGPASYKHLDQVLGLKGVNVHLYGKTITKPHRKMGHATIVDESLDAAKERALQVKELLKIVSAGGES